MRDALAMWIEDHKELQGSNDDKQDIKDFYKEVCG